MDIGTLLIQLSFILGAAATACSILAYKKDDSGLRSLSGRIGAGCFMTTTASMLLLTYYLFTVNLRYSYVVQHSSVELAWYYRIAALWAGQEGSFLLWTWMILLVLVLIQYTNVSKDVKGTPLMDVSQSVTLAVATFFLLILVIKNPLHSIDMPAAFGYGMNPLLRNPWMAIHPPVLFAGYALLTIPYAAAVGYLLTDDAKWTDISRFWGRLAWLFLTLGIGIGGFWAYEVLGWGAWYWSWDPVETSSLVPWVTATAFLHCQSQLRRGEYKIATPLLAVASFILVIFATFVTRSGLWASVHSWQEFALEGQAVAIFLCVLVISSAYLLLKKYTSG